MERKETQVEPTVKQDFLKPGDKVLIVREATKEEDVPGVYWPPKKKATIGKIGTVMERRSDVLTVEAYKVKPDDPDLTSIHQFWTYPRQVLQKVNKWKLKKHNKKKTT